MTGISRTIGDGRGTANRALIKDNVKSIGKKKKNTAGTQNQMLVRFQRNIDISESAATSSDYVRQKEKGEKKELTLHSLAKPPTNLASAHSKDIRDVVSHLMERMDVENLTKGTATKAKYRSEENSEDELKEIDIVDRVQEHLKMMKEKQRKSKRNVEIELMKKMDEVIINEPDPEPMPERERSTIEFVDLDEEMAAEKAKRLANENKELRKKAYALKLLGAKKHFLPAEQERRPFWLSPPVKHEQLKKPRRSKEDDISADRKLNELLFKVMSGRDNDGKKWARVLRERQQKGPFTKDMLNEIWKQANEIMGLFKTPSDPAVDDKTGYERVIKNTKFRDISASQAGSLSKTSKMEWPKVKKHGSLSKFTLGRGKPIQFFPQKTEYSGSRNVLSHKNKIDSKIRTIGEKSAISKIQKGTSSKMIETKPSEKINAKINSKKLESSSLKLLQKLKKEKSSLKNMIRDYSRSPKSSFTDNNA